MYESVTLSLTGNATILSVIFFPSINLYEDSEIALLCLQSFNSFPNINENNNKFSIKIVDNENNNAPMICLYNSENLTKLTFDISVDHNDFRSYIKCNGILHFEIPYIMAPVCGFEKRQYKSDSRIIQQSQLQHLQSYSIKEFFPSGRTESKLIQSPPNLIYYKLNKTNIDSITVQLVDQDHNPIYNFGETLTIVLNIKRYGS
ncbi:hypothetical protein AGLY_017189 [Aphis glycines]|uniref:Uncharacterized protein n=1 Tax=Aphis glycines TaxID=307491 RepID=A0A6G0SVL2_APHGL|nr:hypothetical protein AGLY_017189 [Aphis glycines]